MNNKELVKKLKQVANNYKTLYVMGCFGAPMTESNKERYIKHHPYNQQPERTKMIRSASNDTFGFDCVNLAPNSCVDGRLKWLKQEADNE
jgi:hypothetical protein